MVWFDLFIKYYMGVPNIIFTAVNILLMIHKISQSSQRLQLNLALLLPGIASNKIGRRMGFEIIRNAWTRASFYRISRISTTVAYLVKYYVPLVATSSRVKWCKVVVYGSQQVFSKKLGVANGSPAWSWQQFPHCNTYYNENGNNNHGY